MRAIPLTRDSVLWRILLYTAAALTAAFAVTGFIVQRRVAAISEASLESEIRTSLQAYESAWKVRVQTLAQLSQIMSSMSDVRAAFMTRDQATIQDTAGQLWSQVSEQYAIFLVLDPAGGLIASLSGQPKFLPNPSLVTAARAQFPKQVSGYAAHNSHLYYVVLTPVYVQAQTGQDLLNILLIAYDIDGRLARELKAANGSDFVFVTSNNVITSTLPGLTVADINNGVPLSGGARRILVRGQDYLLLHTQLRDTMGGLVGELFIIRSLSALKFTLTDLSRSIALFWIGGLLVACGLTYMLFRRVLRPIQTLDRAAAEVIRRNYDYRVPIETTDELGRLARTFNQMCDSIRSARDDLIRQEQIATIGRLSSSIVHDLRNPLAAIYGGAEMLVDAELSSEQQRRLAISIYSSSRRIQELLQELLDVSRGKSFFVETCSLADIVFSASEHLSKNASSSSVEIDIDVPADIEVAVSRDRVNRVFVNLIDNAIDAMPDGGAVRISARADAGHALILVEDTGPGIADEAWQNLFRPFATYGKKNGLGLGLALSRQVLLDHGGDLWVEPSNGAGARFLMRLSLVPPGTEKPISPRRSGGAGS